MDAVSQLIRLARPEGRIDMRCLLAGWFGLANPASSPGTAPFHLLLKGRAQVEFAGRTIQLRAGDARTVLARYGAPSAHRS
jgi:AraC family transcriptional regulator, activator of mtrCDE